VGEVLELFSGVRQVVHLKEGLLLGFVLVPCHENVLSFLSFLDSKVVTW
jgi:hypothetical protein